MSSPSFSKDIFTVERSIRDSDLDAPLEARNAPFSSHLARLSYSKNATGLSALKSLYSSGPFVSLENKRVLLAGLAPEDHDSAMVVMEMYSIVFHKNPVFSFGNTALPRGLKFLPSNNSNADRLRRLIVTERVPTITDQLRNVLRPIFADFVKLREIPAISFNQMQLDVRAILNKEKGIQKAWRLASETKDDWKLIWSSTGSEIYTKKD